MGASGIGGDGAAGLEGTNGGGGGGGGFFGGGGGGGGCSFGGGGGGGGSSFSEGGLIVVTTEEPNVRISYRKPPTISIASPVAGATITQGQALTASYECTSPEGIPFAQCAGSVADGAALDTSTLGPHTLTVHAEDAAEGTADASASYTVYGPPSVTITSPTDGATYTLSQVVNAAYSCGHEEGTSIESCAGPVASGAAIDTATPGPHTFMVKAEDDLGGESTESVSYSVSAPPPAPAAVIPDTNSARTRRRPSRPRRRRRRSSSASAPTSPAPPSSANSTRAPSRPAPRRRPTRPSPAGTPSPSRPSLRPEPTPRLRPSASRSRRRRRKSVRGGEVASL